jgi:hypothetical protein
VRSLLIENGGSGVTQVVVTALALLHGVGKAAQSDSSAHDLMSC